MNIGIDLGTTNSALAYIPEIRGELPDYPEIQVLAIPQYVAAGQTEARLELPPGKHTLQLVLGDAEHYPFKPPVVSEKITVTVK